MTHAIAFVLLLLVVLAAAAADMRTEKVPNRLTYPAIAAGLVFWAAAGLIENGWGGLADASGDALFAAACGLVPFALLVLSAGLGGGDMKLMGAVGALSASWEVVLSTTVYALIIAVIWAVGLMLRHGIVGRVMRRIVAAALLAASRVRPSVEDEGPKVPFAAAIAVGAIIAGAEQLLHVQTPWSAINP